MDEKSTRCRWILSTGIRCGAERTESSGEWWVHPICDSFCYCPDHKQKGIRDSPEPVIGEKFNRLMRIPIEISDPEVREDIMNFELTGNITLAHIARLLELAFESKKTGV